MALPTPGSAYLAWLSGALTRTDPSGSTGTGRDVVLGYATGYDAHDIAPFVRSLRAVFNGEIGLVVDDRPDVNALMVEHDAIALRVADGDGWRPHPVMARFAAFDRFLAGRPDAGSVLLTDVRDVIFQAPPFAPLPQRLEVFVEADRLGDHAFNMKYLRAVAGEVLAERIAAAPSLCVGTVMGPREAVIRFCRTVLMLAAVPRSELGGAFGADQAACNLAVHLGLLEADIRPNYGRVATIGLEDSETLTFEGGRVINPDGSTSAVVHQHDRHPHLAEAVHALWGRGLAARERVRPKAKGERAARMGQSIRRRLPELR